MSVETPEAEIHPLTSAANTNTSAFTASPPCPSEAMLVEEPSTVEATAAMSAKSYVENNCYMIFLVVVSLLASVYILSFISVMIVGTDNDLLQNTLKGLFDWTKWLCWYGFILFSLPVLPLLAIGCAKDEASGAGDDSSPRDSNPPTSGQSEASDSNGPFSYKEGSAMCAAFCFMLGILWALNLLFSWWLDARYEEDNYYII